MRNGCFLSREFSAVLFFYFYQTPPIDSPVQYDSGPIASSRVLCERGDIKRLNRRDILLVTEEVVLPGSHQHGHHSGLFRSRTGERDKGRGKSQAALLTGVTRYSSFSHCNISVELCSFFKLCECNSLTVESKHCAETC